MNDGVIDLADLSIRDGEDHREYVARRDLLLQETRRAGLCWFGDLSHFEFETDYDAALVMVHSCGHRVELLLGGESPFLPFLGHFLGHAVFIALGHREDGCLPRPQRQPSEIINGFAATLGV